MSYSLMLSSQRAGQVDTCENPSATSAAASRRSHPQRRDRPCKDGTSVLAGMGVIASCRCGVGIHLASDQGVQRGTVVTELDDLDAGNVRLGQNVGVHRAASWRYQVRS